HPGMHLAGELGVEDALGALALAVVIGRPDAVRLGIPSHAPSPQATVGDRQSGCRPAREQHGRHPPRPPPAHRGLLRVAAPRSQPAPDIDLGAWGVVRVRPPPWLPNDSARSAVAASAARSAAATVAASKPSSAARAPPRRPSVDYAARTRDKCRPC